MGCYALFVHQNDFLIKIFITSQAQILFTTTKKIRETYFLTKKIGFNQYHQLYQKKFKKEMQRQKQKGRQSRDKKTQEKIRNHRK